MILFDITDTSEDHNTVSQKLVIMSAERLLLVFVGLYLSITIGKDVRMATGTDGLICYPNMLLS